MEPAGSHVNSQAEKWSLPSSLLTQRVHLLHVTSTLLFCFMLKGSAGPSDTCELAMC